MFDVEFVFVVLPQLWNYKFSLLIIPFLEVNGKHLIKKPLPEKIGNTPLSVYGDWYLQCIINFSHVDVLDNVIIIFSIKI